MSIVRCTAYPFRYAEEAYAESADEADALELFEHYRGYITGREDYELVGVYGDHGKSGRKMDGRPELGRLLTDCEAGRIDLILTKSIARFSHNMRECVSTIRRLQTLGVRVPQGVELPRETEGAEGQRLQEQLYQGRGAAAQGIRPARLGMEGRGRL